MVICIQRLKNPKQFAERGVIMRPKGIDRNGRLVIPKPFRKELGIKAGDDLEMFVEGNRIIIEKKNPFCAFCDSESELVDYNGKKICKS